MSKNNQKNTVEISLLQHGCGWLLMFIVIKYPRRVVRDLIWTSLRLTYIWLTWYESYRMVHTIGVIVYHKLWLKKVSLYGFRAVYMMEWTVNKTNFLNIFTVFTSMALTRFWFRNFQEFGTTWINFSFDKWRFFAAKRSRRGQV